MVVGCKPRIPTQALPADLDVLLPPLSTWFENRSLDLSEVKLLYFLIISWYSSSEILPSLRAVDKRDLIWLSVFSAKVCIFSCFFALCRKNLTAPMQEVETNEKQVAIAIKGPPTTTPTAEREAASPEVVRTTAAPLDTAHTVWQRVCHRLNLAEVW